MKSFIGAFVGILFVALAARILAGFFQDGWVGYWVYIFGMGLGSYVLAKLMLVSFDFDWRAATGGGLSSFAIAIAWQAADGAEIAAYSIGLNISAIFAGIYLAELQYQRAIQRFRPAKHQALERSQDEREAENQVNFLA